MNSTSSNMWYTGQEEQLMMALDNSALVSITDPNGIILHANKALCLISGYEQSEIIGKNHYILTSEKESDRIYTKIWAEIKAKNIWKGEMSHKRKDGTFYWVNATIVPMMNENGDIEKYVTIRFDITESKEIASEIVIVKNRFSSIYHSANDAIFIIDHASHKIINANNKAESLLGYSRSDFIGMSAEKLYPKADLAHANELINQLYTDENIIYESRQEHKDGNLIEVEISCKRFHDGSQEVLQCMVRDVSERKIAEAKLRVSELNKDLIIENIPYSVHRLDVEGVIRSMNSTGIKMLGLEQESDVEGKNYIDLLPNNIQEKIRRLYKLALDGASANFEIITDTGLTWASSFIPIMSKTDGVKVLGITEDITEQRKKEKLIMSSEEKFRLIFDSAPDAYFITDMEGNIVQCNSAAVKMSGCKEEDLINGNILNSGFLSEPNREIVLSVTKIPSNKPRKFEFQIQHTDGQKVDIELISHHVVIDDERLILSIARDVTDHNTALRSLQAKTEDLKLFLYRSSHDLRAPYTSLQGLINLIKLEDINDNTYKLVTLFEDTLSEGKLLIDNLVTASEITSKKNASEEIDFNVLIQKVKAKLQSVEGFEQVRFILNIPKVFKFNSNWQMLSSLVLVLLQNAIKYKRPLSEEHTPFVVINAVKSKGGIHLTIKDNGMGIAQNEVDKIFDLYYRSNTTISGTGLGLYVAKNVVEQLNGTIAVESALNDETKFDIQLPNLYVA